MYIHTYTEGILGAGYKWFDRFYLLFVCLSVFYVSFFFLHKIDLEKVFDLYKHFDNKHIG